MRQAQQHYDRAIAAQRIGDWATYGREIDQLGAVLNQLRARGPGSRDLECVSKTATELSTRVLNTRPVDPGTRYEVPGTTTCGRIAARRTATLAWIGKRGRSCFRDSSKRRGTSVSVQVLG